MFQGRPSNLCVRRVKPQSSQKLSWTLLTHLPRPFPRILAEAPDIYNNCRRKAQVPSMRWLTV